MVNLVSEPSDSAADEQSELDGKAASSVPGQGVAATAIPSLSGFYAGLHRRILQNSSFLSILDQAIVSGTTFLTAAIIGRTTSPEELGLYYIVLSIVLIILGIQDQVVAAPYVVYSKRRKGRDRAEYAGSIWVHSFVLAGTAIVFILATIGVLAAAGMSEHLPALWALLGAVPLLLLRNGVRRFSFANLRVKHIISLDVMVTVFQLGGLALLAHYGLISLLNIYAVMGGACGLACIGWYFLDPPSVSLQRTRVKSDWLHNWIFGKWALRTYLASELTPYLTIWILGFSAGAAATGILGACTTIVGLTRVVLVGLDNVLIAQAGQALVAGGMRDFQRVLLRTAGFLGTVMGAFCIVVLVTGDWLTVLAFGSDYEGTGMILFILALSMLPSSVNNVTGNGLWALDQPRLNFNADLCCMVFTLLAAVALIVPFGALGAAMAVLIGSLTSAIVRTITLLRHLQCDHVRPGTADNYSVSS